jgi:hypothetical protein
VLNERFSFRHSFLFSQYSSTSISSYANKLDIVNHEPFSTMPAEPFESKHPVPITMLYDCELYPPSNPRNAVSYFNHSASAHSQDSSSTSVRRLQLTISQHSEDAIETSKETHRVTVLADTLTAIIIECRDHRVQRSRPQRRTERGSP